MLTLIALSVALMQQTPAPAAPEVHTRFRFVGSERPGGLDRDGDGQITREEFAAPMNDHFARLDKDGDGRLSTEELAAGHGAMTDGEHDIILMRRPGGPGVRRFEMRRSGGEARAQAGPGEGRTMVFVDGAPGAGGEREIVIHGGPGGESALDADNDGRISEAEFTAPLREAFARMDADGSGFIEAGERGAGHGAEVFVRRIETRQNGEE